MLFSNRFRTAVVVIAVLLSVGLVERTCSLLPVLVSPLADEDKPPQGKSQRVNEWTHNRCAWHCANDGRTWLVRSSIIANVIDLYCRCCSCTYLHE